MSTAGPQSEFPINIFPESIQQIIAETHTCLGYPIDYMASSILFAASVAIGCTHKVKVKTGFIESAALYMALVGKAGINKSHPLTFALKPIFQLDTEAFKKYKSDVKAYKTLIREFNKAAKEKSGKNELVEPQLRKFIVSDTTPEALATTLANNLRGIGLHVDELAGWFKNFNKYNSGSETEFWLSAWSGMAINVDRKSSDPIYIPNPFISVAGTIQNGILDELAKGDRSQNGFIDRILFVIPSNIKKECWSTFDLDERIINLWADIVKRLCVEPIQVYEDFNVKPNLLVFDNDAKELLLSWQKKNTDDCNNEDNSLLAGAYSKMDIYVVRLALILQLLYHTCEHKSKTLIETKAINGAIMLVEYFKLSAIKVHSILDNPLERLSTKELNIYEALPELFQTNEGVKIAISMDMPERNFKRFIEKQSLFERYLRGNYRKRL